MSTGYAKGKLTLESRGRMVPEEILRFHPELRSALDEIKKEGWKYLYIETRGKAIAEVNLEKSRYKIYTRWEPMGEHTIEVETGPKPPEIKDVPEVEEFRVNVSTKSFPRAATVDLSTGVVTYLHEAFWGWEKEWEKDLKKLSEAKEIYEVARWLLEVKRQRLHESYSLERYKDLRDLLEELIR